MISENAIYKAYNSDSIEHGVRLKVEHNITLKDRDMTYLISKSIEKLQAMREESAAKEDFAYYDAINSARQWEKQAAVTRRIDRAIEYLKVPETEHTSNKWVKGKSEFDFSRISNKVYTMSYRIYERSSWRTDTKKYEVKWYIYTNSPRNNYNVKVAGQEKTYTSKEDAEKYVQGRIKAYSRLFTEISPPIPKEYEKCFKVYGHLLPGYTTEEMLKAKETEKPSIRNQLNSLKAEQHASPKKAAPKRAEPEI